jgi:single-strand DNA-binding protein
MINKVTLVGNLGKDPEVRHLETGSSVARIKLATNESYKDKNGEYQTQTEWHTVIVWRELAKKAERELKKGSLIYVEGKLRSRMFKDSTGVDKYITEIEAYLLKSLDKRERLVEGEFRDQSNLGSQPSSNDHSGSLDMGNSEEQPF